MADTYGNYICCLPDGGRGWNSEVSHSFFFLCAKRKSAENSHLVIENAVSKDANENDMILVKQEQKSEREIPRLDCQDISG